MGVGFMRGLGLGLGLGAKLVICCLMASHYRWKWSRADINRMAMGMEQGIQRLEVLSGKVFDPEAVKVFVDGMRRGEYRDVYDEAQQQVADTQEDLSRIELNDDVSRSARRNIDPDCLPPEVDEPTVSST